MSNHCDVLAESPLGPLRVRIPLGAQLGERMRFDHVDVALAVARCEPLWLALEAWLLCPLDPAPVQAAMPQAAGLDAQAPHDRLAPRGTTLHVPWSVLLARPLPLQSPLQQLQWPTLPCELELARYAEAPAGCEALQPGCLLLLPQAFEPVWQVRLHLAQHGLTLAAKRNRGDGRLQLLGAPQLKAAPGSDAWRVVLAQPPALTTEAALGWRKTSLASPARACLLAPGETRPLAQGEVVPALNGAALWIDSTPFHPNNALQHASHPTAHLT